MLSIFLLIPLSLMLFVVAIWAVRYAVKSNQFEDLDNASQRIILDDRQERRQTIQAHDASQAQNSSYKPAETKEPSADIDGINEVDIAEVNDIKIDSIDVNNTQAQQTNNDDKL